MTNLSDFTKEVAPDVIGCPDLIMERAVLATCRDFCRKTWVLSNAINLPVAADDIDTDSNNAVQLDLTSALETSTKAIAFKSFLINKFPVQLDFLSAVNDSTLLKREAAVKYFTFLDDTTAIVFPITKACTVDLEVVYMPIVGATAVPDLLYDLYLDDISYGVKSRLFRQPGKSWTNLNLVPYNDREYRRSIISTKRRINKDFNRRSLVVQPRSYGEVGYHDNPLGYLLE